MTTQNKQRTVLLTGGSGFIGHHCVEQWLKLGWRVQVIDSFRHKGSYSRLDTIPSLAYHAASDTFKSYHHNLNAPLDAVLLEKIRLYSGKSRLDYIVNMASNSAVERSNQDPVECWTNNCNIIINMLEAARTLKPRLFFQISTDEVYGDCTGGDGHKEWSTLRPSNVYAASKAAQEQLCYAYYKSFKVPVVITNTMNNYGERQDPEKFIPQLIRRIHKGEKVQIYTSADGTMGDRYYMHCVDHADAIRFIAEDIFNGGWDDYTIKKNWSDMPPKFNIAGKTKVSNMALARMVAKIMGKVLDAELVFPKSTRPSYDLSYGLDSSLLDQAGWSETIALEDGLRRTIEFTLENLEWMAG